jgi:voltage-gated potassium channel
MKQYHSHFKYLTKETLTLIKSPAFITLTILGNSIIGLAGTLFYYLEKEANPKMVHFIDAIWWSFSTATTTGYGDITPVTSSGKILGILLMLIGTALFAMFTGLFAEVIFTSSRQR